MLKARCSYLYLVGIRESDRWLLLIAIVLGTSFLMFAVIFDIISKKIGYEVRWRYMKAVLTQEAAWYDEKNINELPTVINTSV